MTAAPLASRALLAFVAVAAAALPGPRPAGAEVFHSRQSALELAFPQADTVRVRDLFLSEEEAAKVVALAGSKLPSRLVSVYEGWRADERLGWAFFETHTVRTLPETLLVVIGTDGRVTAVHLLAFHEPPEYQPPPRWLQQVVGRPLDSDLGVGRGIVPLAGSTLSARAVTAAVRRVLAICQVMLAGVSPTTAGSSDEHPEATAGPARVPVGPAQARAGQPQATAKPAQTTAKPAQQEEDPCGSW